MPKPRKKIIMGPEPEILSIPDHYVALPGKIPFAELAKLANEGIIPKGTLVNMDGDGVVKAPTSTLKANAILFNSIKAYMFDEVDEYVNASVLVHGFVRPSRLHGDLAAAELKRIGLME